MENKVARRFVSACLEMQWNARAEERARRLATAGLDWVAVRQFADAEQLAPLLYRWVHGKDLVPASLEQHLAAAYHNTAGQNTLRLADLERLLDLLAAQGIPVILLKGAALVESVYGNAAVRPMEDIDLLVRPEALPQAIRVLSDFCGTSSDPASQPFAFVEKEREIAFQKDGKSNTVFDLHWQALDSPFYPHTLFTQWVWDGALPLCVGGSSARMLAQEALLLQLSVHDLIDESRKELLWRYDIASALSKYRHTIDWELLIAQAQRFSCILPVQRVFANINDEWKGLIPNEWAERVNRPSASPVEMAFDEWVRSKDRAQVRLLKVNLASQPSWRARLMYLVSNIFPPMLYMQRRYRTRNALFVMLAYPYRWFLSLYRAIVH